MNKLSNLELQRQRAAKNQSLFREVNERIEDLTKSAPVSLFVCECMNDTCDAGVEMSVADYEQVRAGGNRFFVLPGHEVEEVEAVIETNGRYLVVAKLGTGGEVAEQLDPRRRTTTHEH